MLRRLLFSIFAVLIASSSSAAVLYDFRQTSRSDARHGQTDEVQGRGAIEGARMRVDYTAGGNLPPGSFMISRDGASRVIMVSPADKTWTEVDMAAMADSLAGGGIEISNLKMNVKQLPDHPTVSGFHTDHYRIETSYQITWRGGPLPLTQNVETVVEKWTTSAFGDVAGSFVNLASLQTGNPQVDQLLETETAKIKGLPLRQITTIVTSGVGNLVHPNSKLGTVATRKMQTEILLSNVRVGATSPTHFEVPAGFTRAGGLDQPSDENKMHVLSMEPATP
ncbi:MAG TPA: hypothetical protein VM557_13070 [Thermoanaerobaculia bacterium]|nr:hypothetical protein [Thermoanaerobaculia bacterium]